MSAMTQNLQPQRPWRTAILCGMASYLDAAALVASGTAVSVLYAPSLGLTPVTIGVVLACQQFSFAVGALLGGRLGDRFGRRRLLTSALILFAIGMVVLATAGSPWMLIVGAILAGLGIGSDLPVALAMANEVAPPSKKGRMVVLSQLMWTLGIASVQLVVSFVGHLGATGARILFAGLLVVAVGVLGFRILLPESAEWQAARQNANRQRQQHTGGTIRFDRLGHVFRRPVVYAVLATAIYYATWNVGASINGKYGGYIWTEHAGGDIETFSRFSLLALPLIFLAGLLFMAVVDSRRRRLWTAIGTILIICGWAPLALFGASQATMLAVVFLTGVGSCLAGEPLYKVWSQELIPTLLRGTSQGMTMATTRVVAAILALVVPSILAANTSVVFIGIFIFAVVSAAVWLFWIPRLSTARELEQPAAVIGETPPDTPAGEQPDTDSSFRTPKKDPR